MKTEICVRGLKKLNTSQHSIGESDLVRAKSKGYLTYHDWHLLLNIIKHIESCFEIHVNSNDVFEKNFEWIFLTQYKIEMYLFSTSKGYATKYFYLLYHNAYETIQLHAKLKKMKIWPRCV